MRFPAKKILCVVLPIALLLIASHVWALEEPPDNPTSSTKQELSETIPELAEIIPLSTALSSRLVALENKIRGGLDVSAVEREYTRIEADLKDPADQLQRLKDSKDYRFNMLVILREKIEQENTRFKEASRLLYSKRRGSINSNRPLQRQMILSTRPSISSFQSWRRCYRYKRVVVLSRTKLTLFPPN
jgi:hypothetical protein